MVKALSCTQSRTEKTWPFGVLCELGLKRLISFCHVVVKLEVVNDKNILEVWLVLSSSYLNLGEKPGNLVKFRGGFGFKH